jgi:glycosyltransferase involved in cell wall biosynthesis
MPNSHLIGNTSPIVTVLMPVYNAEKFLQESIESVLNQTFTDFEFLIINDGSTDGSEDIILSYEDERIRYYKNPKNLQLIKTLNKGLDLATGKFIARMDADDICLPERFEKQMELMQKRKEIAVCGSWYQEFGGGKPLTIRCRKEAIELKCHTFFGCPVGHPASMIRSSALKQSGLKYDENYPHVEDWKLWSEMVKQGFSFYNIQNVLLLYRRNPTSVSALNKVEQNTVALKILTENITYFFPSINVVEYSAEIKNIFKPLPIKNNLASFKALDTFFTDFDNQNTGQLDTQFFRKKLTNMWEYRLSQMSIKISSKILIILNSSFLGCHKYSLLVKIRLVLFYSFQTSSK